MGEVVSRDDFEELRNEAPDQRIGLALLVIGRVLIEIRNECGALRDLLEKKAVAILLIAGFCVFGLAACSCNTDQPDDKTAIPGAASGSHVESPTDSPWFWLWFMQATRPTPQPTYVPTPVPTYRSPSTGRGWVAPQPSVPTYRSPSYSAPTYRAPSYSPPARAYSPPPRAYSPPARSYSAPRGR